MRHRIVIFLLFFPSIILSNVFSKIGLPPFKYSLSGYIKGEIYSDSRQTIDSEDDDQPFFPTMHLYDPTGKDINARGQTTMDAFETRLRADFEKIQYDTFSIEGMVETDFEIFFPEISNLFHLRHAYGKIYWKHGSLLFGQTWHPMVLIETLNVNYNGSTPFDYYARSPQLTFAYETESRLNIMATAAMQVDFVSDGPYGETSQYMRWATMPNLHLQIRWLFDENMIGCGIDYKRIAPRIASDTGFRVYERLSSVAALWYIYIKWPASVELYVKINAGQNSTDYNSMSGYAVQKNSTDPTTEQRDYVNLMNVAGWFDISITKNPIIVPGVFAGVSKNLGAHKPIERDVIVDGVVIQRNVFGFANNVDSVFRISPRISGKIGSTILSVEVEYTRAYFGTITDMGNVINTTPSECIRPTFAGYYYF